MQLQGVVERGKCERIEQEEGVSWAAFASFARGRNGTDTMARGDGKGVLLWIGVCKYGCRGQAIFCPKTEPDSSDCRGWWGLIKECSVEMRASWATFALFARRQNGTVAVAGGVMNKGGVVKE